MQSRLLVAWPSVLAPPNFLSSVSNTRNVWAERLTPLSEVVADFDTSAAAEGLSRFEALEQMTGADFIERRRADMERTFDRHAILTEDLRLLAQAGPFIRAYHAARFTDGDVASAAWDAFQPAVPLNLTGAIFAGFGFFVGLITMRSFLAVIRWPFRRRTT